MNPLLCAALVVLFSSAVSFAANAPQIPADAERAAAALKDSPRHGEFVDVPLPGQDAKLKCFIAYPERAEKAPVVLVIHEIFGLTDWVRAVCDQLAADGFIAVAPDMLSGMGPNGGGTESFEGDKVRDAIRGLSADAVTQRLDAARDYATNLDAASGKFASIGFCWGGAQSFAYATRQPALSGAVVYYGSEPPASEMEKITCPVVGFYGKDDARITAAVPATDATMEKLGKRFDSHIYDGAGHGLLRQQSGREGANLKASEDAWAKTVDFVREVTK